MTPDDKDEASPVDFLRAQIAEDLKAGKNGGRVHTRFPPEPNGYLHIGHSKAICIDFGIAAENNGLCNLRFDDTNPEKETIEFEESIKRDIKWLGYDWEDRIFYASDYYEKIYECAVQLIRDGKAYVDSLNADEIREHRGTLTDPGKDSPYRNRSAEESLDLFTRMRAGEFADGAHVVRAKIDMSSGNINMRDPVLFRIKRVTHYRIGDKWCIYPMYDFAHTISDALEGITHSLCTLEFEDHRPLYEWILDNLKSQLPQSPRPRQIEFARLNVSYMITSKRKLLALVRDGHVRGWDDPRMPTLSGLRRAGYTAEALRNFVEGVGVAKRAMVADLAQLEHAIRESLNKTSPRVMAVLRPLKVVIENYPDGQVEELEAVNNPADESAGTRRVPFSRELYIEQDDFRESPPPKFFRLSPGREVRLRYAYFITCKDVIKDAAGNIVEVRCTYDPLTKGGNASDGRSPKATMHWVSAPHGLQAEVRLYDRLFADERPTEDTPLNPNSLEVLTNSRVEPSLAAVNHGDRFQFERMGYFCVDLDSKPGALVFNRTVTLRDTWTKIEKKQK
jgi:glutaminyl-tRNA synthetase